MALSPLTMSMSGTSMLHIETTMYNFTQVSLMDNLSMFWSVVAFSTGVSHAN